MAVCLAGAGELLRIAATAFTLSWTHTIEKTLWVESWMVTRQALVLTEVKIKGSGAGMEPPAEARLVDGWYVWHPDDQQRPAISLRRAPEAGDWTFCASSVPCAPLGKILPAAADPVILYPCD
jgi:hypothetical protein